MPRYRSETQSPCLTVTIPHSLAERAKLARLRSAVQLGWDDLDAGRFIDVGHVDLPAFIEKIGRDAALGVHVMSKA